MKKKLIVTLSIILGISITLMTINDKAIGKTNELEKYIDEDIKNINEVSSISDWTMESNQASANLGLSLNKAGDVNGDGYDDIIIGAPYFDNSLTDVGKAYVFYGSPDGYNIAPNWVAEGEQAGSQFGFSANYAGDVNDDGYDDVIIGAPQFDGRVSSSGKIYLYLGSSTGLPTTPNWTALPTNDTQSQLGYSVGTAGDVNGDGYYDVIIGAPGHNEFYGSGGAVFVYYGSAGGLGGIAWSYYGKETLHRIGLSTSTAGDVNNDGYSDIIIGDRGYEDTHVFHGSYTGLPSTPNYKLEGDQSAAYFGNTISNAGDVNGDGYDDVIVGAYQYDNGQTDEGRAFVYHGSTTGLSTTPTWIIEGGQDGAKLGFSLKFAGDVNNDGYDDVIVGAPGYNNEEIDEGRVYLYIGSEEGLFSTPHLTFEDNQERAQFGYSVSSSGDLNGNGHDDILISAPYYDNSETDEGVVFAYINNPPTANSGLDQSVNTLSVVNLNGNGSSDPDGDTTLTYQWTQTGGTTVTLSGNSAVSPTFTAPNDPTTLTFSLVVTDSLSLASEADTVIITVNNQAPLANAGEDQSVNTLTLVTLDGSLSSDPDGDTPLTYQWTQTGGTTVTLSGDTTANPTFSAPNDPATLTFSLVVTDSLGLESVADTVKITVNNQAPIANAGEDQSVNTLTLVTLDGSLSSDPNGDTPLTYQWTQTGGTTVTLSGDTTASPTFTAPNDPATLTFSLVVTDSLSLTSEADTVKITINNQAPIANAGEDQSVNTLTLVTLDGSLSSDPDGDTPLTYKWTQTGGTTVTLSGDTTANPTFTSPSDPDTLTFSLVVTDSLGLESVADVVIIRMQNFQIYFPLIIR